MHLFKSEWLREPSRARVGSYAGPAYGTRYVRHPEVDAAAPTYAGLPSPEDIFVPPQPRPGPLDRAA